MHRYRAQDLSVALSSRAILHNLSFSVATGRWLGVLGPNGSGKTTLMRTLGGHLPYSGSISLDGRQVSDWPAREMAKQVALVRQSFGLGFDFSVEELVLLGRAPHRRWLEPYDREDRLLVQKALSDVDLDGFGHRSMLALSGGEQRRVLLAQALTQQAGILLLDEPTTHLDVHHQYEFLDRVRALVEAGTTVIGVFHDLSMAARYVDDVLVLSEGRIVSTGSPIDVLSGDLIADVFRMDAHTATTEDGRLEIRFTAPIPRTVRVSDPITTQGSS